MTQHDHEVVERGSGAVAAVAIVVLVILAILAVVAFGGLNWLRNNGGGAGGDTDTNEGDNPSVLPTVAVPTLAAPTAAPPASFWSPAGAGAAFG